VLVWFHLGILVFILILFSVAYRTVCLTIVFGRELGDGEAVCFQLISLFISVCWLEKLMLSCGTFVVVLERSHNVYSA
jgi:hypothetical protein